MHINQFHQILILPIIYLIWFVITVLIINAVILIKAFSDDDIKELQSSGEIVVAGHTLTMEDIKLLYTVDPARSSVCEAHSDG